MTLRQVEAVLGEVRTAVPELAWTVERLDPDYPPDSAVVTLGAGGPEVMLEVTGGLPSVRAHFEKFVFEVIPIADLKEFLEAVLRGDWERLPSRPHPWLPVVRRIRVTGSTRVWDESR